MIYIVIQTAKCIEKYYIAMTLQMKKWAHKIGLPCNESIWFLLSARQKNQLVNIEIQEIIYSTNYLF
jgi:hypothetical protein